MALSEVMFSHETRIRQFSDIFTNKKNYDTFSDVTLVTGDSKQIKAHKIILSNVSIFFQEILLNNIHPHPLIYLSGITFEILKPIVDFIYRGECKVPTGQVEIFLTVCRELKVEELSKIKDVVKGREEIESNFNGSQNVLENPLLGEFNRDGDPDVDENKQKIGTKENAIDQSIQRNNEEQLPSKNNIIEDIEAADVTDVSVTKETFRFPMKEEPDFFTHTDSDFRNEEGEKQTLKDDATDNLKPGTCEQYDCDRCEYKTNLYRNLQRHNRHKHVGAQYNCDQCEYITRQMHNLKNHIQTVHEGIKYECDQCQYKVSSKYSLRQHKASVHEGIEYSCTKCQYIGRSQENLKYHTKSVHDGIKFDCDQCPFRATKNSSLQRHRLSVHDGVKY